MPGLRPSRGQGVISALLGAQRPTLWVAALYRAPRHHPAADWQGCLAHQLRDGQCALEAGDTLFAPRLKAIRLRALAMHHRRDTRAACTVSQDRRALQRRVDQWFASPPTNPPGRRLPQRSAKIRDHLCLFRADASIPPTNTASEPALRRRTGFRKVTHGVRSAWGRDLFAAVRSVGNTDTRQGLSAYQAIQQALSPIGSLCEPSCVITSSRMKLAYLLGLLEVDEYRDLELIRKMRNECAHSHKEVDLSRSPYRDRIFELKSFQKSLDLMKEELDKQLTEKGQEPRNQILAAIGFLCAWLGWRAEHANRPSSPNLTDLKREALRLGW